MCGFACNAVTRLTQERSKEKHHEERTIAFGANRGIERNAGPFYLKKKKKVPQTRIHKATSPGVLGKQRIFVVLH